MARTSTSMQKKSKGEPSPQKQAAEHTPGVAIRGKARPVERLGAVYGKDQPGLPRGKSRIPAPKAREAQRQRQLRAVMVAVAEIGYPATTIGDIVARARVSRREFYALFESKEACFIAACQAGLEVMMGRLMQVLLTQAPRDPMAALIYAVRLNLRGMADEPEFTRCIAVGTMEAGVEVLRLRVSMLRRFYALIEMWHRAARQAEPQQWRVVPKQAYTAVVGGISELITTTVLDDRTAHLPELEEIVVDLMCSVLGAPPSVSVGDPIGRPSRSVA